MYQHESPYGLINFSDQKGTSGYYSQNVTQADAERVKAALTELKILSENTRLVKTGDNSFIVKIASVNRHQSTVVSKEGLEITLEYGDFSPFLEKLVGHLKKAGEHSANENQKRMIERYVEHFVTGDVNKHKESQMEWVKDKEPAV